MEKGLLQRLAGYMRDLFATGKADPPAGESPGDSGRPRLTVIEGGKGTTERDGNERKKPCAVIGIPYSSDAAENTVTREEEEDVMKTIAKYMFTTVAVAAAAMLLAACGGGGGGTSSAGGTVGTAVVTTGTMTKGSVIVNGIRFEDTAANIHPDDTNKVFLPSDLKDGMTVKVKGQRNDDGVTGTATEIEVENEVRGTISSPPGVDSFIVLGQTVFVDGGTVFANVANFAALSVGDAVEVHGSRDSAGAIRATRVELLTGLGVVDELRGVVAGKDTSPGAGTFTIGGATFTYDGNTLIVGGTTFSNGNLVEIHLAAGTNLATRIELEDAEDVEFEPAEGQEFEVEGFVTGLSGNDLFVNGQAVRLTGNTRYEGGINTDLANDVKVEAEGHMVGGVLVADEIKFKDAVRFETNVESKTSTSLNVLGRTVHVTSKTVNGGLLASLDNVTNPGVKIRAFLNQDNTFTATELQPNSKVDPDKHIVQGLVISSTPPKLVLIKEMPNGFTVDTTGLSDVNFQGDSVDDTSDAQIGRAAFFGALKAGQTVVKAKGTYDPDSRTLTATEVEIE